MSTPRRLFAERLRMLRAKSQMNQEQLADPLGVSQNLIGKWERDESEASASQVAQLCKLFNVSGDYLLGLSDFPQGLAPDTWIIDLDVIESGNRDTAFSAKIPRRYRIVDYKEMQRLEEGGAP